MKTIIALAILLTAGSMVQSHDLIQRVTMASTDNKASQAHVEGLTPLKVSAPQSQVATAHEQKTGDSEGVNLIAMFEAELSASLRENQPSAGHNQGAEMATLLQPFAEEAAKQAIKPMEAYMDFAVGNLKNLFSAMSGPGPAFKDKARPLEISVINRTPDTYIYQGVYFDSGRTFDNPYVGSVLKPGQIHLHYVANKDTSFFTGVSGVIKYTKVGDNKPVIPNLPPAISEMFKPAILIGFSNPYIGGVKCHPYSNLILDAHKAVLDCLDGVNNLGVAYKGLSGVPSLFVDLMTIKKADPLKFKC